MDGIGYDLDEAKRLLTEAKAAGFDGQVHLVGTNDPLGTETSIAVQAMLSRGGFTVQLDNDQNTTQMISQIITGDFDLVGWGLNIDDSSPWMKLDSHLGAKSPGNYWGLQDPEFEAAITATKTRRPPPTSSRRPPRRCRSAGTRSCRAPCTPASSRR